MVLVIDESMKGQGAWDPPGGDPVPPRHNQLSESTGHGPLDPV